MFAAAVGAVGLRFIVLSIGAVALAVVTLRVVPVVDHWWVKRTENRIAGATASGAAGGDEPGA